VSGILERLRRTGRWIGQRAAANAQVVFIFIPITLLALAIAAYGWWWGIVADNLRAEAVAFQAAQRDLGRALTWDALKIEGFPYRVDATLSLLDFTAPDRGATWKGERVVVHVPPLSRNRIDVALEGQQYFFYAKDRWIETNARADKALVSLTSNASAQRVGIDIERLTGKAKYDATDVNFIVERAVGGLNLTDATGSDKMPRVEIAAELKNIALQGLDLPLGPSIALIQIDAGAKFPSELPQASATTLFAEWRRRGTPIQLKKFELEWGGISVGAVGEFTLDANTLPEGSLRLKLGNHARILELLEANGWITRETRVAAKPVLDVLAFISGDTQRRVSVPLKIKNGDVFLGPARVATLNATATSAQLGPLPLAEPASAGP